jgi:isocitrate dehydrogenase (NAD+)
VSRTITVIPGDGIGPEIMECTLRVLVALKLGLQFETAQAGLIALEREGALIPAATHASIEKNRVALKGPLTTPIGEGFTSINVALRKAFDLYSNVRPAISFSGTKARYDGIDIVTIRENTEGAYGSEGATIAPDDSFATSQIRITRAGCERIVRCA